eukprot:5301762-Prymnesium_polylepis.1
MPLSVETPAPLSTVKRGLSRQKSSSSAYRAACRSMAFRASASGLPPRPTLVRGSLPADSAPPPMADGR